jgi:hypothetical protein
MHFAAKARWGMLALALAGAGLLVAAEPQAEEKQGSLPPLPARNPAPRSRSPEKMAYLAKLQDYRRVRDAFERQASAYWDGIADKRSARRKKRAEGRPVALSDYVLEHPPVYDGPPEPPPPPSLVNPPPPSEPVPVPVVADFLEQAKAHFGFVPEAPASEAEFKRAYAEAAIRAGIRKDQAVRIYGFEASGNGRYDVQAGLESGKTTKRRAISTALGYNQLLITNTLSILAGHGSDIVAVLAEKAGGASAERRARIETKIGALKQMMQFARTVPSRWDAQDELAKTPKAWGVHALNLDLDIGPLLQAQKLADSIVFAQGKGYGGRLTAAELEMMNLMGDGSGFDVISMPEDMRAKVPTANMFQRGGYERNAIVRKFNTISGLLSATDAKMDAQTDLPGAKELETAFEAAAAPAASAPVR